MRAAVDFATNVGMQRTTVSSSNLKSVGYDAQSQTLEIEFNKGDVYQYLTVPQSVYLGLMKASSKGEFFDSNIKKAGYSVKKVG